MVIAKDFVMIFFPKTGSSFTRKVIKSIHHQRTSSYSSLKKILIKYGVYETEMQFFLTNKERGRQHGNVRDIPQKHFGKEIVSITRNPFSRLLSIYHYQSWLKNPYQFDLQAQAQFNNFPNLNLEEFIRYKSLVIKNRFKSQPSLSELIEANSIGPQTIEFFEFYFPKPKEAILKLCDQYIESKVYLKDMYPITFLRQENLTEDLCGFLTTKGYSAHELDLIKTSEKVNVSQINVEKNETLWTQEAIDLIKFNERYLFEIMSHFSINYYEYVPNLGTE